MSKAQSNRIHVVFQFTRDLSLPRFSVMKGERWAFVAVGALLERLAKIKCGERFDFAGGQCLASDVVIVYEGPANMDYMRAAGYLSGSQANAKGDSNVCEV